MVCFAAGCVLPAYADTVLYSTGFEGPAFTAGVTINGQNGWATFGPASASQVENSMADTGSQALDVFPALASGQSGAYYALSTSATEIEMSADIYLASSSNQSGWQFAGFAPGLSAFVGGIDISSTGVINLIDPGNTVVTPTFTYGSWQFLDFVFNFTTQTYTFSLNGAPISSNVAFCGSDGATCTGANVSSFGDALFDTFPAAGTPTDNGFMDNLSISSVSSVPEPRSLMLMGAGLALLIARRLKR